MFNRDNPGRVRIDSEPAGADVRINGKQTCVTPCSVDLDRSQSSHQLSATLPDHEQQNITVYRQLSSYVYLNGLMLLYGVIGLGIDWYTNAMWTFDRHAVLLNLSEVDKTNKDSDTESEDEEDEQDDEPVNIVKRLPDTPALLRMKELVPESYLEKQVRYYYGVTEKNKVWPIVDRLYLILIKMSEDGERVDVDEAIRRDHFRASPKN